MHVTKYFSIPDMDCASCVNHIEHDVSKLKGVHHISVNFAMNRAEVMFDPDIVSVAEIVGQIKKTGYKATLIEDSTPMTHASHGGHTMPDGSVMSGEDHSAHAAMENDVEIRSKAFKVIFGVMMSSLIIALSFFIDLPEEQWIMMVATASILLYTGREYYMRGIPSFLMKGRPNMDTLVALGVTAAFLYSTYNVVKGVHEDYFMDSAIIATFIMLGRYLEAKAKGRAGAAIKKLLELSAKVAHLITGKNATKDVPIDQVTKGDLLLVKPGEKIPVDGVIFEGSATIDESMVTGESIPLDKKKGDTVIGATINGNTAFRMKAEKVGKETMLAQMVKLVEQAQMSKAPIQRLVDIISSYFVWAVLVIAVGTFAGWYWYSADLSTAMIAMVAVLIIACPCALGLATPISIVVGSGKGASLGILMKHAESLEKVHRITTICFDKTGTITKGHPEVQAFDVVGKQSAKMVLEIAQALESQSEHPLAQSVLDYCWTKKVKKVAVVSFNAVTGKGVSGKIRNKVYYLGSSSYLKSLKIDLKPVQKSLDELHAKGQTVLLVSDGKQVLGYFAVQDGVKESSKKAIELLKARGVKTLMMTGDHAEVAQAIAEEVGIDEVLAQVTPQQKTAKITALQKDGEFVAMVGDGINDSPALTKADVGIAMGTGTDIAIESGDIVLVKGDLLKAVEAISLSETTLRNIKQNLFWAFIYNVIGIPIAALGMLNPIYSALAMALSSISVVLNALRLNRFRV